MRIAPGQFSGAGGRKRQSKEARSNKTRDRILRDNVPLDGKAYLPQDVAEAVSFILEDELRRSTSCWRKQTEALRLEAQEYMRGTRNGGRYFRARENGPREAEPSAFGHCFERTRDGGGGLDVTVRRKTPNSR